jgi:hypothetical protein
LQWCDSGAPLLIWGKVEGDGSEGRMIAQRILPLTEAEAWREFRRLTLAIPPKLDRTVLMQVRDVLIASPGDCTVLLVLEFPDGERVLLQAADRLNVRPSMELLTELEALLGVESVRLT